MNIKRYCNFPNFTKRHRRGKNEGRREGRRMRAAGGLTIWLATLNTSKIRNRFLEIFLEALVLTLQSLVKTENWKTASCKVLVKAREKLSYSTKFRSELNYRLWQRYSVDLTVPFSVINPKINCESLLPLLSQNFVYSDSNFWFCFLFQLFTIYFNYDKHQTWWTWTEKNPKKKVSRSRNVSSFFRC